MTEEPIIKNEFQIDQKETVKLMKMSRGYQWEIKLLINKDLPDPDNLLLERLKQIDDEMKKNWGAE